jgi:two-component system nitrogen regulation sensor histidine kinase NtrY
VARGRAPDRARDQESAHADPALRAAAAPALREQFAGNPEDEKVFDECVDAITSQVDTLKVLVDEFQNFARLPTAQPRPTT